jgi:hypothetical protein
VNGGAGNRNKTSGDAIFHCHFYPHFAQGMWYHIRIKDTFERGTVLAASGSVDPQNPPFFDPSNPGIGIHGSTWGLKSGKPAQGARALPDGELPDGSPIPAIVPLPGKPPLTAAISASFPAAVDPMVSARARIPRRPLLTSRAWPVLTKSSSPVTTSRPASRSTSPVTRAALTGTATATRLATQLAELPELV